MEYTAFGGTGMNFSRTSFGALPIQRISDEAAVEILHAAYDAGVNFYDTARAYPTSEHKLGLAFSDVRDKIYIATKSMASDADGLARDIEKSLSELRTDHVDILQFHLAKKCHRPGEADGLYDRMLELKKSGAVRHIGITTHRAAVAHEAVESGLYESLQFPFSYLSDDQDLEIVKACEKAGIGFIAMKSMAGGLITNSKIAFAYARQFPGLIPIWGVQRMSEMREFLEHERTQPVLDDAMRAEIERDRAELSGNFCRACGYCMPCPADIPLSEVCRMPQLIRRMQPERYMAHEWREKMELTKNCLHCGACAKKCPYELEPEKLIALAYDDYVQFARDWDTSHA